MRAKSGILVPAIGAVLSSMPLVHADMPLTVSAYAETSHYAYDYYSSPSDVKVDSPAAEDSGSGKEALAPTATAIKENSQPCSSCSTTSIACDSSCDSYACSNRPNGLLQGLFAKCGISECGAGCDAGCDSFCGRDRGLLGYGLIQRSDRCFNDFISPMTNPVFFEDPRTLSEVRFIFINHELPGSLGGNSVQVYAAQVRAALTERLSIIATKDGLIHTQSPILDSGLGDVAAGLKYNLFRDTTAGRLVSAGFTYEIPMGSNRSLQGNGNGEYHLFLTSGARIGEKSHWLSASGFRIPGDENLENEVWYWSNHFDRQLGDRPLYAFTEINWFNFMSSGNAFPLPVEGGDIFNLGSPGITGNDIVTQAIGMKAKPRHNIEAGVAWEFPLTERRGLLQDRLTADLIFRY